MRRGDGASLENCDRYWQKLTLLCFFLGCRFKLLSQEEGEYFNVPVQPEGEEGNEELRQKFEVRHMTQG